MTANIEGKILIVDDDAGVLSAANLLLKRHFRQVDTEKNPLRIPYWVNSGGYDVILLDMNFTRDLSSGKEGFEWLDKILDLDPSVSVVLFTAYGDVEMAVRAIKSGAKDFVLKPWQNDKLVATLKNAMEAAREKRASKTKVTGDRNQRNTSSFAEHPFIGNSEGILQILTTIERVAATDANILILGENGTGKDLVAKNIHQQSKRKDKPFVTVDLGAISESLFESELFGHVKGSFTDAKEDRTGKLEEADGGTIFLDEIGNISLPMQAKLLTVLQNRTITKVGSNKAKPIDVRLVCATNKAVYKMVNDQQFRQDLLYRINTIEIQLPPLRERKDDIPLLADYFVHVYAKKYNRTVASLNATVVKQLQKHHWPGNVRELQHAIERAVILSQGDTLQPEDFKGFRMANEDAPVIETLQLEDMEVLLIKKALQKFNGNITETARELGLTRASLYRRLEKYGI
ncbi:sigma-54 dependent transcriptional regulator [Ferruginibacter paludis]|uniref:sigma-54-dependent transcriptional regulator n=1 Tax=Ferruginibacter TaxID=1004303 RepID=UPI0025B4B0C8|nr:MULTISPECIES: sigma-54 dependent transcriptional regulator [Ferruginibacter]MDB5279830.1 two component, sigma54 specific, transcriptional regulator, Fis family [Ferruginibacter sp.]MDN3655949.1 sigma-54 dependent transcriptional regulator [Ferruginibacter paludis]